MKKLRFLLTIALAISTMAFVSCNDDDKDDNNNTDPGAISAFFPEGYNASNVAAWYLYSEVQQDGTRRANAVFLFNDNTILVTNHKIKSDGREYKKKDFEGTYNITSGNYDNGTAHVQPINITVTIQNGKMTPMGDETFTKQSNANIPAPSKPVDGDDNGGGDGDGGDGDGDYATTPEAYLPSVYASKTISAWYSLTDVRDSKTKINAIFLFNDGSMVVTKSTVYTKADGRDPEYEIEFSGTYNITSGNYNNGTAFVPEMDMTVTILNGVLSVPGLQETYTKQNNANAPAPK